MKFRKRPVVIEARQFNPADVPAMFDLIQWLDRHGAQIDQHPDKPHELIVGTLEDGEDGQVQHVATAGDWIIRGVQGEFYPCKPDIFASTYEPVEDAS
jgi:hypothetical protein